MAKSTTIEPTDPVVAPGDDTPRAAALEYMMALETFEQRTGVPIFLASIMASMYLKPGLSIREIKERCGLSQPMASRHVDEIRNLGLCDTEADPKDRRRVCCWLTQDGIDKLHRLSPHWAVPPDFDGISFEKRDQPKRRKK